MITKSEIEITINQQYERMQDKDPGYKRELVPATKSLSSHALIISGIRRCGKSTLLLQMMRDISLDKLQKSDGLDRFLFLNFDTPLLYGFGMTDFRRLDEIIVERGATILFFDELQLISGWEMYVRQKLDEGLKVIVTGSNAGMLSNELGSRLTGRHITQELFPFSYGEYLGFRKLEPSAESFRLYMEDGGFPEFVKTGDEEQIISLFDDILMRDIVARYGLKDPVGMKRIAVYLMSNIGNRISASKLRQPFSIGATSTITTWFSYLETSYLFNFVPMFSYSAKVQLVNPRKVYSADPALVKLLTISKTEDTGKKLENIVYLHLRRLYDEICYFDNKGECDFVAFKNGKLSELIQVCASLNQDNLTREIDGLTKAMKFFKQKSGTILTLSESDTIKHENMIINIVPAWSYFIKP